MRMSKELWFVLLAGVIKSIATAFAVTAFDMATVINAFTFSLWFIIPAGAGLCGFAAASGYYFGAKYLHVMPSKQLLLQMVVVAAFTQLLIYWLEYETAVVEGQSVSSFVPFTTYIDVILTKAHYQMGRGMQIDTGEIGSFGYFLAFLQFLGFMVGGAFVYIHLSDQAACKACGRYLHTVAKKEDSFDDYDTFAAYYDGEFQHPVDTPEFAELVGTDYTASGVHQGSVRLETRVMNCPQCNAQSVVERVRVHTGRDWKDINELTRRVNMPAGVDVSPCYAAQGQASGWM
jgi:transcription elongation factor Elf1